MIIDSQVQFWKFEKNITPIAFQGMDILQQNYLPQQLQTVLNNNEIDFVLAVQSNQTEVETLFLNELAKTNPIIKGVIGWVDLENENIAERLIYFSQFPTIKGFRYSITSQSSPNNNNLISGIQSLQNYHFTLDILSNANTLNSTFQVIRNLNGPIFILNQCGMPDLIHPDFLNWQIDIKNLATLPNVYCKLSGLFTQTQFKNWKPADFYPYLRVLFDEFGTNRLLFASDWPNILVSGLYVQWKSLLTKFMQNLSNEETEKIWFKNALQVYNL